LSSWSSVKIEHPDPQWNLSPYMCRPTDQIPKKSSP